MAEKILTAKNGLIAGVAVVGLVVANGVWEDFKEENACGIAMAREGVNPSSVIRMAECMSDNKDGTGSTGKVSDLTLEYEKLTTDAITIGFGEVEMGVNTSATFTYEGNSMHDMPLITDVRLFYNRNKDQATVVRAMPCFNAGSYTADLNPQANAANFNQADDETKMKAEIFPTKDGSGIKKIVINAGTMEYCMAHVKQIIENQNLWDNNDYRNIGTFGTRERAAYVQMMEELITLSALAQGCPEEQLQMDKVQNKLADLFMGEVIRKVVDSGGNADMVREAYDEGKVDVKIEPPSTRQNKYSQQFQTVREGYINKSRFPAGLLIEDMEIGSFATQSCNLQGATPEGRT